MNIIWIVNTLLPQIAEHCGLNADNDGGWLSSALDDIKNDKSYNITVCFLNGGERLSGKTGNIKYYSFCEKNVCKYDASVEAMFCRIFREENPDIIHIFGTEFPHTLAAVNACKRTDNADKCVISIQGLISRCAEKYYAGLPASAIYGFSPRDLLKLDNVYFQKKSFKKRGKYEIEALKKAKNVIGRTEWDYACVKAINPDIEYFKCNESLRSSFYEGKWDYDTCEKHSVFISQGYYPLKGIHNVIRVFGKIIEKYPDAHIYTTNEDDKCKGFIARIKHRTHYQAYLKRLIKKHGLCDKITYLGALTEKQMRDRLLKSNAFLLCSSIENSSNSLGEAMLLGVPCVSSDVGGVKSLITNDTEGFLYPFDEPYMIVHYINKIFSDAKLADKLSKNARAHALITHSRENNQIRLKEIYSDILSKQVK